MIIKQSRVSSPDAKSVIGLARYVLHGHADENIATQDRCLYTFTNSKTQTVWGAAAEMIMVNETSLSRKNKHEHYIISLAKGEHLTADQWQSAADAVRKKLGYSDTFYFAVVHKDRECEHMHLCVSNVDPVTHKKINPWNNRYKCLEVAKKLNGQLGLQDEWSRDLGKRKTPEQMQRHSDEKKIRTEKVIDQWRGQQSFKSYLRTLADDLKKAQSWDQFIKTLGEHDVLLKRKGQGLIFVSADGKCASKASEIDRKFSLKSLISLFDSVPPDLDSTTQSTKYAANFNYQGEKRIAPKSGSDMIAFYLKKIVQRGDRIEDRQGFLLARKHSDRRTAYDMLKIARLKGWKTIAVTGDPLFKEQILRAAVTMGVNNLEFNGDAYMQKRYADMMRGVEKEPPKDREKEILEARAQNAARRAAEKEAREAAEYRRRMETLMTSPGAYAENLHKQQSGHGIGDILGQTVNHFWNEDKHDADRRNEQTAARSQKHQQQRDHTGRKSRTGRA